MAETPTRVGNGGASKLLLAATSTLAGIVVTLAATGAMSYAAFLRDGATRDYVDRRIDAVSQRVESTATKADVEKLSSKIERLSETASRIDVRLARLEASQEPRKDLE